LQVKEEKEEKIGKRIRIKKPLTTSG